MKTYLCPVCGSEKTETVLKYPQYFSVFCSNEIIPEYVFEASFCHECSFLFQKSGYFNSEYDKLSNSMYSSYEITDQFIDPFPHPESIYFSEIEFVSSIIKSDSNVLDIGSNRGDFLYHLKKNFASINILGLEPSKLAFTGVPTIKAFFDESLFSGLFDLITMRHVLEHIPDPVTFLRKVAKIMDKESKLFIEVPNTVNDLTVCNNLFSPDHVNYFTENSLTNVLIKSGFTKIKTLNKKGSHLFILAEKNEAQLEIADEKEIINLLESFNKSQKKTAEKIEKHIDSGGKLVFYGAKNAFIWIFGILKSCRTKPSICYLCRTGLCVKNESWHTKCKY